MRAIKSRLTMKNTGRCLFVDKINRKEVWLFIDCYGVEYMAQSKFGFRVKRT